jgi:hypothetical protein
MSRKGLKTPVGAHTPQQMLLTPGVSVIKFILQLVPFAARERIVSSEGGGGGCKKKMFLQIYVQVV